MGRPCRRSLRHELLCRREGKVFIASIYPAAFDAKAPSVPAWFNCAYCAVYENFWYLSLFVRERPPGGREPLSQLAELIRSGQAFVALEADLSSEDGVAAHGFRPALGCESFGQEG